MTAMRVGIIGTGAIADKHAQPTRTSATGLRPAPTALKQDAAFAAFNRRGVCGPPRTACARADVDFLDVCTFRPPLSCGTGRALRQHVLVQKTQAIDLETAAK